MKRVDDTVAAMIYDVTDPEQVNWVFYVFSTALSNSVPQFDATIFTTFGIVIVVVDGC